MLEWTFLSQEVCQLKKEVRNLQNIVRNVLISILMY